MLFNTNRVIPLTLCTILAIYSPPAMCATEMPHSAMPECTDDDVGDTDVNCYTFKESIITARTGRNVYSIDGNTQIGYGPCSSGYMGTWTLNPNIYVASIQMWDFATASGNPTLGQCVSLRDFWGTKSHPVVTNDVPVKFTRFRCEACNTNYYIQNGSAQLQPANWTLHHSETYDFASTSMSQYYIGEDDCDAASGSNLQAIPKIQSTLGGNFVNCDCDTEKCNGILSTSDNGDVTNLTYRICGTDLDTGFTGCLKRTATVCKEGWYISNKIGRQNECTRCPQYKGSYDGVSSRSYVDNDGIIIYGGRKVNGGVVGGITNCYVTADTTFSDETGSGVVMGDCDYDD